MLNKTSETLYLYKLTGHDNVRTDFIKWFLKCNAIEKCCLIYLVIKKSAQLKIVHGSYSLVYQIFKDIAR